MIVFFALFPVLCFLLCYWVPNNRIVLHSVILLFVFLTNLPWMLQLISSVVHGYTHLGTVRLVFPWTELVCTMHGSAQTLVASRCRTSYTDQPIWTLEPIHFLNSKGKGTVYQLMFLDHMSHLHLLWSLLASTHMNTCVRYSCCRQVDVSRNYVRFFMYWWCKINKDKL